MHATTSCARVCERRAKRWVLRELTCANRARDAHEFLVDDPSRTDVLMSNFGVPHDRPLGSDRKSDILAARAKQRPWPIAREHRIARGLREFHCVECIM